jgi:hypothetical protein
MASPVVVSVLGNVKNLQDALDKGAKSTQSFGDKVHAAGQKMTAFATVPIAGFLALATKAAIEDAAAQDKLATVVKNLKGDSDALVKTVEEQILKFQKVSTFTDDQLRPAYQNLLVATKDVKQTQDLMTVAMDVAAAKGLDLETVTKAMAKAHDGNTGALSKLGIAVKDASGETLSFEQIMANATKTFGGSAQAAAETTSGKMQNLKRDLGELTEQIGTVMLPIVQQLADKLLPVIQRFSEMDAGTQQMIVGVGLAVAAIGPLLTSIRSIHTALTFLAAHPIILFLASLTLAINDVKKSWDDLQKGISPKGGIPGSGISVLDRLTGGKLLNPIRNVLGDFGNQLMGRAGGGPISGPAIVGERGPELFLPSGSGRIVPNHLLGGGGTVINVTVNGALDPVSVGRQIIGLIQAEQRRTGTLVA